MGNRPVATVAPGLSQNHPPGWLVRFLPDRLHKMQDEAGQTMAEYAVVLGVITIAVVVTLASDYIEAMTLFRTSLIFVDSRPVDTNLAVFDPTKGKNHDDVGGYPGPLTVGS